MIQAIRNLFSRKGEVTPFPDRVRHQVLARPSDRALVNEAPAGLRPPGFDPSRFAHQGDPCRYCHTPHDDVPPGPCKGRLSALGYAKVETRWDGVEHYRWLRSDGKAFDIWSHVSNRLPYYHFGLRDEFGQAPPWLARLLIPVSELEALQLAQAIEARSGETAGLDPEGESAVDVSPCAQWQRNFALSPSQRSAAVSKGNRTRYANRKAAK